MQKIKIISPLPGTFYRRPSPETDPYKVEGDSVKTGEVVGLVEVMKNFHEIRAEESGEKIVFLAKDSDPIQPGDIIAELEK